MRGALGILGMIGVVTSAMVAGVAFTGCGSSKSGDSSGTGGATGMGGGTQRGGGAIGTGGMTSNGGVTGTGSGGIGSGSGGSTPPNGCVINGSCSTSAAPCSYCSKGGTVQYACQCTLNGAGQGYWNCGGVLPCGSGNYGPPGSVCDPRFQTSGTYCDSAGSKQSCTCQASTSPQPGMWVCSPGAGNCGVACGTRTCLVGEICVSLGRYPGTLPMGDAGSASPSLTPNCVAIPDACAGKTPSCSACIVSAFGCGLPGTCRDVSPQAFECILGGA